MLVRIRVGGTILKSKSSGQNAIYRTHYTVDSLIAIRQSCVYDQFLELRRKLDICAEAVRLFVASSLRHTSGHLAHDWSSD